MKNSQHFDFARKISELRGMDLQPSYGCGQNAATRANPFAGSRRDTLNARVCATGSLPAPISRRNWPSGQCCSG